jgi:hypothetical protein
MVTGVQTCALPICIERVRILSLSWGNGYSAVKILKDGSDSNARNAYKQIYFAKYSGWQLEE